jgi:3D (Asp-Asp-Asp) domain-containing protein
VSARATLLVALSCALVAASCFETRGSDWIKSGGDGEERAPGGWVAPSAQPHATAQRDMRTHVIGAPEEQENPNSDSDVRAAPPAPARGSPLGTFRNTYYSFPSATDYSGAETAVFDAQCREIAKVPQAFHDTLCVQGSGRLASGRTVSYAKRDCGCAQVCPRTGQRICFEALDPAKFPWGRGATGRAIYPARSLAVDTSILPLGTAVYIPAYVGLPLPGGGVHDGCFRAEDRGLKVTGRQIDVFAGNEQTLRAWNQRVPTGRGVELYADPGCAAQGSP